MNIPCLFSPKNELCKFPELKLKSKMTSKTNLDLKVKFNIHEKYFINFNQFSFVINSYIEY